jgi:hypothetical protein
MLLSFWFALAAAVDVPAVLQGELTAALTALKAEADPPYYVALAVDDHEEINIGALDGALSGQTSTHLRYLDVDVRTGTPDLDSTHLLRGFSSLDDDDRDWDDDDDDRDWDDDDDDDSGDDTDEPEDTDEPVIDSGNTSNWFDSPAS